jgi:hypothetical protein
MNQSEGDFEWLMISGEIFERQGKPVLMRNCTRNLQKIIGLFSYKKT